jgi:putative acetyltransferase
MIREFKEEDTPRIIDIWLTASIIAHDFIEQSYWEEKIEDMQSIYLPSSKTFVYTYEDPNNVLGFVSLVDNYIAAIFVEPTCQGKGIGKQLISFVKEKHNKLELGVYSKNLNSISFYKQQGFLISGEKIEEHTGETELIMTYTK